MIQTCVLCGGKLQSTKGKAVQTCEFSNVTWDKEVCWKHSVNELQRACALDVSLKFLRKNKRQAISLIKKIGDTSSQGSLTLEMVIIGFSDEDRALLLNLISVNSQLRKQVLQIMEKNNLSSHEGLGASRNYDHLPLELKTIAESFHQHLQSRYKLLVSKGHLRSADYVRRYMSDVVSFLNFMVLKGCGSWQCFSKQMLVSYLSETNRKISSSLKKFFKFVELKHNPFKKTKTDRPKRKGSVLVETPAPSIMNPHELEMFIADIKNKVSDPEYALAWMICRMGLTLENSYNLKLNQFKMTDNNELVFKPASVWVVLPKTMQKIIGKMIYELLPEWYKTSDTVLSQTPLFHHYVPSKSKFSTEVLQGKARVLRPSAIFAMMQKGHLDRVSIKQTTGVSMKVITNLERLFTADLHRRLDPELIKQRNQYILGDGNA